MTRVITTKPQLDELIDAVRVGRAHFVGYEPPLTMIAVDNQIHETPVGHLIEALMDSLAHSDNDTSQTSIPCACSGAISRGHHGRIRHVASESGATCALRQSLTRTSEIIAAPADDPWTNTHHAQQLHPRRGNH